MEVADPTPYSGVDFIHYHFKRFYRPLSLRECGDTILDRLQGFLRWLNVGIQIPTFTAFPHPDGESEKVELSIVSIDDFSLCLIEGKFQPLQYLSQYRHCLLGFVSPAEYDDIVSVPDDAGTQLLLQVIPHPYPVQYVQVEIGQQR